MVDDAMALESKSAARIGEWMMSRGVRFVLAESCTCGLLAAQFGSIPGISSVFCGSAVTYREATKVEWIDVEPTSLERETAVSRTVAREMAVGVMTATTEASWSVSITGHLGPNAPSSQDGLVYSAVARRVDDGIEVVAEADVRLGVGDRDERRSKAAAWCLEGFYSVLQRVG